MPRVRAIVATYQQLPLLQRALRGWLRQTCNDFSLVVADDGSASDTRAFLDAFAGEAQARGISFRHVWQEDKGFRKCRILNAAARLPGDESLLLFSDGDCIPPAKFVERHLAVHEPWSLHVGGAVRLSERASQTIDEACVAAGAFESMATDADRRDARTRRRKSIWGTRLRRPNRPKILGLNMAFSRDVFEAINGFDERFESYGVGEDSDPRDRAMRLRPRPSVKVLYGDNDVFHLWHPHKPGARGRSLERRSEMDRPERCVYGLRRPAESAVAHDA